MRYECTLLAVSDLERSRRFYQEVLGMQVTSDFGANVTLDGRLSLQTLETWKEFLHSDAVVFGHQAGELYFEEMCIRDRLRTESRLKNPEANSLPGFCLSMGMQENKIVFFCRIV